ncbi:GerMN domain-containing protein (plasmid) [Embleya sp. NBC_00888]|uniref:GerMN domain-containing protein n=1 Tax=Embleya sp. NBC_00888 TaxID=2975960 RepID=UPI002F90C0AE|nr:GerMN domain-containing protein [Embleya sp. NBC_00888]
MAGRYALPPLAALLLAVGVGCGIPTTGVVEAGEPATGMIAPADAEHPGSVYIYLVADHRLRPTLRTSLAGAGPQAALDLLLAGPTAQEVGDGVTTTVPVNAGPARVTVQSGTIRIDLAGSDSLTDIALDQLVCTAAAAGSRGMSGGAETPVSVTTAVRRLENRICPSPVGT